jgi:signal transduction histidine kinase
MRKKVIIGLFVVSMLLLAGGIYIISTIETATRELDSLITLHQVEILRERLLINIRKAQSDLNLKNTRYARSMDTVVSDVLNMEESLNGCFQCHHTKAVTQRLIDLKTSTENYIDLISDAMTIRANEERLAKAEDKAFSAGEKLLIDLNNMIDIAKLNLESRTRASLLVISQSKTFLYFLVSFVPFFAAVFGYFYIRGFTRPVKRLYDATRRLKSGDLDYRIHGLSDEFGEVAQSFNEMAASLKEQFLTMQRADQMKVVGEWATGLAHEIKNPLAGIKVSVEVLAEEPSIPEEDREVIMKAVDEIKRIELLLKSLLNFAKPSKLQLMSENVNDLLDKTITFSLKHPSLSSSMSPKINVVRDFDKEVPEALVDPMQMQQVFLNILFNAIEAMPGGGTLSVRTRFDAQAGSITIDISDTGIGIDKKVVDRLFQPFFTTKPKGTGFGLAITKQLIYQHGGSISIENRPEGGSRCFVTLPVRTGGKEKKL